RAVREARAGLLPGRDRALAIAALLAHEPDVILRLGRVQPVREARDETREHVLSFLPLVLAEVGDALEVRRMDRGRRERRHALRLLEVWPRLRPLAGVEQRLTLQIDLIGRHLPLDDL